MSAFVLLLPFFREGYMEKFAICRKTLKTHTISMNFCDFNFGGKKLSFGKKEHCDVYDILCC